MKQITTLLVAACMTLAAFAQTPSTVGVALQPRTSRVVGSGTNLFTANADRAVATIDTVARLATLTNAVHGAVVDVRGYATEFDLPVHLRYTLNTNSAASTNRFVIANSGGVGRWVHDWPGDLTSFGVLPSESDTSARINEALLFAAENNKIAKITVGGRYVVTNSISIPSNCKLEMHPDAVFIRQIPSSTADALPQEATVKNIGLTGWQTMGELSLVNSNITLTGIRCRTEDTNYFGFHVFMQGVSDLTIDRPFIERTYRAWAMTIAASNWVVNLPKIRNGGEDGSYVYQDGIHITGGQYGRIIGPDIVSGDDSIGIGQHSMPIRDVAVIGGNLRSTHAQNIRGFIGYDYTTNLIERVGIYNVTGSGGSRNAILQMGTASTNVTRPFKDWVVDGLLAVSKQSGTNPVAFDAGLIVRNVDGFVIKNATVPFSIEPNLLLLDADNVTVENCRFGGTSWTTYNQTVRVERAERFRFLNNSISNTNEFTAYGLYLVSSGNSQIIGNSFNTWFTCIALAGSNRFPVIKRNYLTAYGGSQRGMIVSDLPTNLVFALNEISAPSSPSWSGGAVPEQYVVEANIGYPNPNTDRHLRSDNFGPHVRFVQSTELSTNAIYSANDRFRIKNEEQAKFYASWDLSGSTVFHTLGDSSGSATPIGTTIQGEGGVGANIATAAITMRIGRPTGDATPPDMVFQSYLKGSSGSSGQASVDAMRLRTFGLTANQALIIPFMWNGSTVLEKSLILTNIGGVNYWISP